MRESQVLQSGVCEATALFLEGNLGDLADQGEDENGSAVTDVFHMRECCAAVGNCEEGFTFLLMSSLRWPHFGSEGCHVHWLHVKSQHLTRGEERQRE